MTCRKALLSGALVFGVLARPGMAAEEPVQPGTHAAWYSGWSEPLDVVRHVEVITAAQIRSSNARNLPDLLDQERIAWMTFANYAGGSPTIRGLDGFDVTIVLDGIPIPTSAYRFGDLEFLSTIDLEMLDRIELVPAAAASTAGWSAGPVIRLFTRRTLPSPDAQTEPAPTTAVRVAYRFATVDKSSVAHLEAARRGERSGSWFGLTSRDIGDLKGGGDIGFQRVTGYEGIAGNARLQYFLSPRRTLEFDLQVHEQQNVPQFERVETGTFLDFRLNPRKRALFKLSYLDATERVWADRFETSLYLNQHRQRSFEQLAALAETRTQGSDNDDIEGLAARFELVRGRHRISYGADYSHEEVQAVRREIDVLTGDESSRGPDATRNRQERDLVSLWVNDRIDLLDSLVVVAEGRYTRGSISGPYDGPAGAFDLDLGEDGLAASLGLAWELDDALRLTARWETGFRLPALDEVTSVASDPALVGVPNDDLDASSVDSLEIGIDYRGGRLEVGAAYFLTDIDDAIVLGPSSVGGSTFLDLDRDGLQEPGEPSFVQSRSVGRAELEGLDLSFELRLLERLRLFGAFHAVEGDDPVDGVPLAAIPPDYGRIGARWSSRWRWQPWIQAELRFHDRKSRLSPEEQADPGLDPFTLGGAEILEVTAGVTIADRLDFVVSLENPSDEDYRRFGSFLVAGGRSLAVRVGYAF